MMLHHKSVPVTGARRTPDLRVTTVGADPSYAELRARNLLALALLNHRATPAGLTSADVTAVQDALRGAWDEVA